MVRFYIYPTSCVFRKLLLVIYTFLHVSIHLKNFETLLKYCLYPIEKIIQIANDHKRFVGKTHRVVRATS